MKICFAAAEIAPFAKTGGLADVAGALPSRLQERGHDVRVFMPLHAQIDVKKYPMVSVDFLDSVPIKLGSSVFRFSVYVARQPGTNLDIYFLNCPRLFHRQRVYTGEADEHLRFALFSRGVIECCQRMGWSPDIVHANDWHTALLPLYLKSVYGWDRLFADTKTVLTIHNLAYQGVFPADVVANLGLAEHAGLLHQDHLAQGFVGFLETGLLWAHAITTVSRTYAREIQTSDYGHGLDGLLRKRSGRVHGIVNGIDADIWNPETDPHLGDLTYGIVDVAEGKHKNKEKLLAELERRPAHGAPLFGIVSRLTAQKGFDLLFEPLPELLSAHDVRLVVLGTGESQYESFFTDLERRFRDKVCYHRGYSEELAHRIEAAADIFLMPSRFEPCGLNQMYSQRYGAVPIVRKTGGLADTVELWNPHQGTGTGFVFDHYSAEAIRWAIAFAIQTYHHQDAWAQLRLNGMERDFSWEKQSGVYEELYEWVRGL